MGTVPKRAVILTAGVDNQAAPERLEIAIWAWGPGYESWLIDARQIMGSPGAAEPWDEIARLLAMDWPVEGGGSMSIAKLAADTGGQHTAGVYTQIRRLHDPRIVPIKGVTGWHKAQPVNGPTRVDVTERGRKIKRGLNLWTVAVDVFKSELYRWLWLSRGEAEAFPPGWVHLPTGFGTEEVKQLVAEQLVTVQDRRGFSRHEWQKLRANEQLDMRIYARAALAVLGSDRYGDKFWTRYLRETSQTEPDSVPPPTDPDPLIPSPSPAAGGLPPAATRVSRASRLA